MRRLDDFVPANHSLRRIRILANEAQAGMDKLFSRMWETDVETARASAPEKLMCPMLLQILFSVRSERQLTEQIQYNMLLRWFIGLSMDDPVWVPTVLTKNRQRLIGRDAVVAFFNEVIHTAEKKRSEPSERRLGPHAKGTPASDDLYFSILLVAGTESPRIRANI